MNCPGHCLMFKHRVHSYRGDQIWLISFHICSSLLLCLEKVGISIFVTVIALNTFWCFRWTLSSSILDFCLSYSWCPFKTANLIIVPIKVIVSSLVKEGAPWGKFSHCCVIICSSEMKKWHIDEYKFIGMGILGLYKLLHEINKWRAVGVLVKENMWRISVLVPFYNLSSGSSQFL